MINAIGIAIGLGIQGVSGESPTCRFSIATPIAIAIVVAGAAVHHLNITGIPIYRTAENRISVPPQKQLIHTVPRRNVPFSFSNLSFTFLFLCNSSKDFKKSLFNFLVKCWG